MVKKVDMYVIGHTDEEKTCCCCGKKVKGSFIWSSGEDEDYLYQCEKCGFEMLEYSLKTGKEGYDIWQSQQHNEN